MQIYVVEIKNVEGKWVPYTQPNSYDIAASTDFQEAREEADAVAEVHGVQSRLNVYAPLT